MPAVKKPQTSRYALSVDQVWDGVSDNARSDTAVIINGGKIEAVVPPFQIPRNIETITCKGCLLPGLIDAHVHYGESMGPAFLAAGVTTVRDVGNDLDWILDQREKNDTNPAAGPRILCCGFLHDGPDAYWSIMGRSCPDEQTLRDSIRRHADRKVDAIKLYAGLDLNLFRTGIDEAKKYNLFVLAHLGGIPAPDAIRAGLNEIEHLSNCEPAWKESTREEQDILIDLLLEYNVAMTPTLGVWDRLGRILDLCFEFDSRKTWAHPVYRDIWSRYPSRSAPPDGRLGFQRPLTHMKRFLLRMVERGVTVALGSDTPFPHLTPGFSLHDELALYVDAGIKPVDALRSATSIGAKVLGRSDQVGKVAPGLQADLILVRENPLKDIRNITRLECTFRSGIPFLPDKLLNAAHANHGKPNTDPIARDLLNYLNKCNA